MLTLSQATSLTKRIAKWSAIIALSIILLIIFVRVGKTLKEIIAPTPPPPPTVSFGKLPAIEFPNNSFPQKITYTIDTVTGALPKLPDRANVFKMGEPNPDLLALKKAEQKVTGEGFSQPAIRISGNTYQWTDSKSPILRKLNIDIFTLDFTVSSSFLSNQAVTLGTNLPNPDNAKGVAQSFLSNMSFLYEDLNLEKTKTNLLSIKNSNLQPATSISTAQIIEVDFFQKDVDKMPILYSKNNSSTMNIFVGGGENQAQVVKSELFHQTISSQSSTYPIKTASDAFLQLRRGEAYILSSQKDEDVSVRNIYLGYFMANKKQDFLMPIIVLEGDNGFVAYVSAVKDEWINK